MDIKALDLQQDNSQVESQDEIFYQKITLEKYYAKGLLMLYQKHLLSDGSRHHYTREK